MKRLKKYSISELSRVTTPLSEYEGKCIVGGYSDLGGGLVELSFSEMIDVFGSISNFPSYAFDGPNQGSNLLSNDPHSYAGYSDVNKSSLSAGTDYYSDFYGYSNPELINKRFVVYKSDLGRFSNIWFPESSTDSSSSSQGSSEEDSQPKNETIEAFASNFANSIVNSIPSLEGTPASYYSSQIETAILVCGITDTTSIYSQIIYNVDSQEAIVVNASNGSVIWRCTFP